MTRDHDVSQLTTAELERARRELAASLALAGPGSLASVPILAHLRAVDAELAARTDGSPPPARPASGIWLCSCGFGTDDRQWFTGHLFEHPGHHERSARG